MADETTLSHPDACLFAILQRRAAFLALYNNFQDQEDDESDAMGDALAAIERAAMRCPVTTPAGLSAYAGMVHDAMRGSMAGLEGPDHLSQLLGALFQKIEAVTGAAP